MLELIALLFILEKSIQIVLHLKRNRRLKRWESSDFGEEGEDEDKTQVEVIEVEGAIKKKEDK